MAFHWENGLFFERQKNGSVRVWKTKDGKFHDRHNLEFDFIIDGYGWCSIIASMSKRGESNGGWDEAIKFHGLS